MATKAQNYTGLVHLIERTSDRLYSKDEWKEADKETETNVGFKYYDMLSSVYDTAFAEDPSAFEGVYWINSDDGLPVWVRPGVNWQPST